MNTTNFTLDYHSSITQKISQTMIIKYPWNPYDKKRLEILKMMVSEDITHDDDQLSTKTTQDHEDDGIMETEEDFEEKESLFEDIVCYILYLIVSVIWYM